MGQMKYVAEAGFVIVVELCENAREAVFRFILLRISYVSLCSCVLSVDKWIICTYLSIRAGNWKFFYCRRDCGFKSTTPTLRSCDLLLLSLGLEIAILQLFNRLVRALNGAKLDKIFARPFVGAMDGHVDAVSCMAKNPNYLKGFFSGSMDGDIRLWDIASRRTICQFPGHQGAVKGLSVSTDGSSLISCGTDCTVRLWSVPVASIMGSDDASNKSVEANAVYVGKNAYLAVDHQWGGDLFATTGARVEIWNHNRSQPLNTFEWGTDTVISVRFNPGDPNIMATSASDRSIALYDLRMSTPLRKVIMQTRTNSIAWNPMEPNNFTAANEDCSCYSYDLRKLDEAKCVHKDHVSSVLDIDYSPTGREFVTGSYDRTVRIFPYNGGHSREIYHTKRMQRVFCVKFSCDASYVISGSDDTNLRVWKAKASEQLGVLTPREKRKHEYLEALMHRYEHLSEVKRILRHRHLPKAVYKAKELRRTITDAEKQKRERKKAHSAAGSIVTKSVRTGRIVKEVE